MKTVILASAKAALTQLRSYILKNFSKDTWQTTYEKLKELIRNLATFPHLGAIPPELDDIHSHQYRQLICGMNRIIYEVRQDVVYIHLIVDTRRDLSALLLRRLVRPGVNPGAR
jgi:plasmid stabilization system protein ParE